MAVAAFKSSSRRANLTTTSATHSAGKEGTEKEKPQKKAAPIRRSQSVSAFSRRTTTAATNDEISEFLNKRDNPLFWSSGSGSPPKPDATNTKAKTPSNGAADDRRGRSVTKGSWVDAGRRNRSASRGRCVTSESEAEQECGSSKDLRNRSNWNVVSSNGKKGGLVRSSSGIWSGQHSGLEPLDSFSANLSSSKAQSWEDEVSTTSSVGAEEKTIKAVCEQVKSVQGDNVEGDATASGIYETVRSEVRRAVSEIQNDLEIAIRRSNATAIATTNIADIPPDLVNPGAVDLVLDIRREYAKKLEQDIELIYDYSILEKCPSCSGHMVNPDCPYDGEPSSLERAGKLRADLAVEEHRGHELSRILKEILPDPKTPTVQKSRPGRKSSIERRKMSKRLEDEALAYFDECISLSTFDSSDFSSPEDPPLDLATPVNYGATLPQASSGTSATAYTKSSFNTKQEPDVQSQFMNDHDASGLTASSSSKERNIDPFSPNSAIAEKSRKFQFSFAGKTTKTFDLQQDISKYIRNFEKHDLDSEIASSNSYNMDEYNLQASAESLLFDRGLLRNRIESGSLLLCGGSFTISFSPFASII